MEKLKNLRKELDDAKEKLEEAQDAVMDYLRPIVKKLHGVERLAGGYHDLWETKEDVVLEVRWDGSGGPYDKSYRIPKSVLSAADEEAAAEELARQQAREAERQRREGIRAQIAHLQSQL